MCMLLSSQMVSKVDSVVVLVGVNNTSRDRCTNKAEGNWLGGFFWRKVRVDCGKHARLVGGVGGHGAAGRGDVFLG